MRDEPTGSPLSVSDPGVIHTPTLSRLGIVGDVARPQGGEAVASPSAVHPSTPEITDFRQMLFEVGQMLFAGAEPDTVLQQIVKVVCAQVGYDRCLITGVTSLSAPGSRMVGRVGHGLRQADVLQVAELLSDVPVLTKVLETGEPTVLQASQLRPAIPGRYIDLFEVDGTLVLIPLVDNRLGPLGLMFLDRHGESFRPSRQNLKALKEFGEIATLAIQNAALLQDRARLVAMVERSRLASELHDGVTQRLFTLSMTLTELAELPDLPHAAEDLLVRARRDVETGSAQLRQALTQLSHEAIPVTPSGPETFEGELRRMVEDFSDDADLGADIEIVGRGRGPSRNQQQVLMRALRESLTNVNKHASATQVTVILRRSDHHWVLEIHDDGAGRALQIRRSSSSADDHYGLRSLANDVDLAGGRLWISQSGRLGGIQVTMSVELDP